jgi:hypothetical protein
MNNESTLWSKPNSSKEIEHTTNASIATMNIGQASTCLNRQHNASASWIRLVRSIASCALLLLLLLLLLLTLA